MSETRDFGATLVEAGYLFPTGIRGVLGRSSEYADIANGLNALVDAWGSDLGATGIQFPPVVNRATFEETELRPVFSRPDGWDPRVHGRQQGAR